jgi:hypothetical protein
MLGLCPPTTMVMQERRAPMPVPVSPPSHPHRLSLPTEPGQREGTLSLLTVAATLGALLIATALGMFFQQVVFDLQEEQLLTDAGFWGYVVAVFLATFIVLPALVGIVLGVRAWRLDAFRLGATGIVVNALIAVWLLIAHFVTLVLG